MAIDPRSYGAIPDYAPSGTVTFLFTDIEGSTRLLEQLRERYATLLAEQRELLRSIFGEWNGYEVDTQGDSFFVAFPRAMDAVTCAIAAQRSIAEHGWPSDARVRVRMAIHTGEPIVGRTGYVGMDVHRAARIGAAGHGGQILLSQTTVDLVASDLAGDVQLLDLGAYRLKDIRHPVQLYQIQAPGVLSDFPPLRTLDTGDEPSTPGQAPYMGLDYFDEADASLFFGREQLAARLAERIGQGRFLAVIGASGSGKSSIVRAGLLPHLRSVSETDWLMQILTPTAHPLEALALAMTSDTSSVLDASTLMDDLAADPRALHLAACRSIQAASASRFLLVVDQFEELFTLCRDQGEQAVFIANLMNAIRRDRPTSVVITLRADFYEHLAAYDELRTAVVAEQEYIGPMTQPELRRAIEAPADGGGWSFSPGLIDLILHDVGEEPGALPLLSHALLETWRGRRGTVMTLKAYGESGGVKGAIGRTADRVFTRELDADQREIARSIFLRLTELGEGTQDTRRRVTLRELIPEAPEDAAPVRAVLGKLVDARLVTTGDATAEVAHEALIREWPTLREWLAQDREGQRLHRRLTEAAHEWELLERDPGALYRGANLTQGLVWAASHPDALNRQEQAFLRACQEQSQHEAAEHEEQRQREVEAADKLAASHTVELRRSRSWRSEAAAHRRLRRRASLLSAALVVAAGLLVLYDWRYLLIVAGFILVSLTIAGIGVWRRVRAGRR
jgi:class 3 adenylate cyclase/energy-coupling factor transporter ATP-binding protein EcfA2